MNRKEYRIKLISKEFLNSDTCFLGFECPEIASNAYPGQFVNISAGTVFLKRPFGIASVDKENGIFYIGVKVVGKGTSEISSFEPGLMVDCLGPLGKGFDFDGYNTIILTGGGTGVFPINFAYETLTSQGKNVIVCEGFRNANQVILNKPSYILTTDCGDCGIKGTVIAGLDTIDISESSKTLICCVGPIPMMKAVASWAAEKNMNCLVSMEQRMACGAGICLCCTVKVKDDGPDGFKNVRCCKEGPVFDSREVVW
ncbi:MAG: dihydroorotate dehydrogenase electron transfer subunit [Saccharofermentans sp.]|nr:dihydroorotate dehydrogenase electron transfer subunit [Saccharofermentans sp.]